jgi:WD40 repeat protein
MWEIQPDWPELDNFYIDVQSHHFRICKTDSGPLQSDPSVSIRRFGASFAVTVPSIGTCAFLAAKQYLQHHGKSVSVNCLSATPDGSEVLSGDSSGRVFLTFLGTNPVPLLGPTPGLDIEDVLVVPRHHLFLAASGDMQIYAFSSTEYQPAGTFSGHRGSVRRMVVAGDELLSGSRDGSVIVWNINKRRQVARSELHSPANDICNSSCGAIFAACDNRVIAVDARTGLPAVSPAYQSGCDFLCIAAADDEVTAGLSNGLVVQWDVRNMQRPKAEWAWYDAPINGVAYNRGRLWAVTGEGVGASIDVEQKTSTIVLGARAYVTLRAIHFVNEISIWTADGEGLITHFEL